MASTPRLVQTAKMTPQALVNGSGTGKLTLITAGAAGNKIVAVFATSTDTATRVVQLWLTRAAVSYLLNSQTVAIAAGSDGSTAPTNMLSLNASLPVDNDGQRYLFLEPGDFLQISVLVAVTAGKEIDVVAVHGEF